MAHRIGVDNRMGRHPDLAENRNEGKTDETKQKNNEVLLVGYALSESGSVLEVDFSMYRNRPHLYNIPPQYLEKLEAKLKSTVHYVIPEYKRQQLCKYNVITVSQVFPFKSFLDKL